MARDILNAWLKLDQITCHDEGDGLGSAEPYLWTVFFKIDGDTVALTESLTLSGTATVVGTPGSHGNLPNHDVDEGEVVPVPSAIGEYNTLLSPIPVPDSLKPLAGDDLPAIVGVVCVLMEEDNVTDDGAEAGHAALDTAVTAALNDIIATRSFSNPDITDEEINEYLDAVADAVADAVQAQQSAFEDFWSWLNKDDLIGSKAFFWKQDDLADGSTLNFSQRWENEGDWELFGHINASVACPAEAIGNLPDLDDLFARVSGDMREFRDQEMGGTELQRWWSLAERNTAQLMFVLRREPELVQSAKALMESVPRVLGNRSAELPDDLVGHAERILTRLRDAGSRQARIDASRALDVLGQVRGASAGAAIERVGRLRPSRTPERPEPPDRGTGRPRTPRPDRDRRATRTGGRG